MAINSNGELWAWGSNISSNINGQLGLGNIISTSTPLRVGTDTNWVSVSCGYYHTLAINANGELYAWGNNSIGQLGIDNTTNQSTPHRVGTATNWVSAACGFSHSGY